MNLLDSPRWKLRRSEDHAQALADEARKFAATNKYDVIRERDTQRGCDVLRMKLAGKPPLPLAFGGLAGECVGSLRCALDHLVWAMSKNPPKPSSVEFPIFIDPDTYKRDAPKRISTIPDEAKREIECLQPYHAGNAKLSHPLWRIYRMANIDKHRIIPVMARGFSFSVAIPGTNRRMGLIATLADRLDEDPVLPIPDLPPEMSRHFDFKVEPTIAVVLDDAAPIDIFPVDEMASFYYFVRDKVFAKLERFVS